MVGKKLDKNKAPWHLMPFEELEEAVRVLEFGAKKYEPENWRQVKRGKVRYMDAAMRHLVSIYRGEQKDVETGLSHFSHLVCSALFAHWHSKNEKH